MEVSYRLHVVGDQLARDVVLPELPGSESYEPGVLDVFGEQVQQSLPIIGATGVLGAITGAKLLPRIAGGGIFKGMLGGVAGAIGGAVLGGTALGLLRGFDAHAAPEQVRTAPVASARVVQDEQLRVMTYNLHGGMGGPNEFGSSGEELDELAEVIRRERPDVLLLQEVDRFATRSNHRDTLEELSERLGADSAVGGTTSTAITGRDQHVAVMTFNGNTISDARNIVHSDPRGGGFLVRTKSWLRDAKAGIGSVLGQQWSGGEGYAVRNTIDTLVRTPAGNSVRFLSGHYEWPSPTVDHQSRQVGTVAGALDAWDGPTIWGADFNVQHRSAAGASERRILGDAGLRDAFDSVPEAERTPIPERSTHPDRPTDDRGGIDRIYVSRHATVDEAYVARDAYDASDHLPVVAEVQLRADA